MKIRTWSLLAVLILLAPIAAPAQAQGEKPNKLSDAEVQQLCRTIVGFLDKSDYANATKALHEANPDKDSLKAVVKCVIKAMLDAAKSKIDIILKFYRWGQKMGRGGSGKFFGAVGGVLADLLSLAVGELMRVLQTPAQTNGFLTTCVKTMQNLGFTLEQSYDICSDMASGG